MLLNILIGSVLLAALLGYDVYLAIDGVKGNTWSELFRVWGRFNPLVPWIWAGLAGHFWYEFKIKTGLGHHANLALLVWSTVIVSMIGIAARQWGHPIPVWCVLIAGFWAGWILWPVGG